MDAGAGRHPLGEGHVAALEQQPHLLPIHAPGLVEAVVEVDQAGVAVADRTLDLLLDGGTRADATLGGLHPAGAQPAGEQVEEVDAVLDEDAAASGAVPEPVFGRQVLVGGVVLEGAVQEVAQDPAADQLPDGVEERVVALHQVGDEQPVVAAGGGDHLVGLRDGQGQRLLADDVLAGLQSHQRLGMVQEGRGRDVDQIDVVAAQQGGDVLDVRNAEAAGSGEGGGAMRAGHADELDTADLSEVLRAQTGRIRRSR